jgi:hypothetical protein
MTARPKTMSRVEAMNPKACGYNPVSDVALSFRISGRSVMNTAPKMDPRMLPRPPMMIMAR